jgi:hypothetical protein
VEKTNMTRKILLLLVLCAILIPSVLAADTYTLDPGKYTDWNLWIISGLIGVVLFVMTLAAPTSPVDVEIGAIISVMSWIPIAFCAYASFNVSRVMAPGVITIYSMPIVGILMGIFLVVAIGNTIRIVLLHNSFTTGE